MLSHEEMVLRVVVGTLLGAAIGYERFHHRRHVGLRTHMIVALASATFMVVSLHYFHYQDYDLRSERLRIDPGHIGAAIVAAVGFIAGGAILQTGLTVQGVTTAAGLWLVTAIGLAAGAGMLLEALTATALGLVTLVAVRRIEGKDEHLLHRHVQVVRGGDHAGQELVDALKRGGVEASLLACRKRCVGTPRATLQLLVKHEDETTVDDLVRAIMALPDVVSVKVEAPLERVL